MGENWREFLVTEREEIEEILRASRRIAVLGIKPESRSGKAAHYVPAYLREHGYDIVPVPVYYPDVTEILGERVERDLTAIDGEVDIVDIFRKSEDVEQHVDDIIELGPGVAWLQLGIRNDDAAERLARAGIRVVQDRCILADHRQWL